jgi:hypothetical protein
MFDAVRNYLQPHPVFTVPDRPRRLQRAASAWVRRSPVILGGGTLIGSPGLVSPYREGVRGSGAVVFGAGVMDPEFPHFYRGRDAAVELGQWVDLLGESRYVGVRGPRSVALLRDRGLEAELLGDPVCFYAREVAFWKPAGERRIGVNLGQAWGRVWGSEETLVASLVDLVAGLVRGGAKIELFVVWPEDLAVARQIARESGAGSSPIHAVYEDAERFQQLVRRLDLFVGLKLHATALAAVAGVPVLCLEYQPKCRDFMRSLEVEDACVRTDQLVIDDTVDLVWDLAGGAQAQSRLQVENARVLQSRQIDAGRRIRASLWPGEA